MTRVDSTSDIGVQPIENAVEVEADLKQIIKELCHLKKNRSWEFLKLKGIYHS